MLLRVSILFWLFCSQPVKALEVKDLYEADVTTQSQSMLDREKALQQAIAKVVQRLMVGNDIFDDSVVQNVLAHPTEFVRGYQYSLVQHIDPFNPAAKNMHVAFDDQKLLSALRNSSLGIWNEIRPETLIWIVVEYEGQQQLFSTESMPMLQGVVEQTAKQSGLPLLYPLMDMQEQANVSTSNVLDANPAVLQATSARYDAVSMLVGLLVHTNSCWRTSWTHYFDQRVRQWEGDCMPLNQALSVGFQGTYSVLGNYYGAKPVASNTAILPKTSHRHS